MSKNFCNMHNLKLAPVTIVCLKPLFLILVIQFIISASFGQSGNKSIPGDFGTIADAATNLNSPGVGSGGVTYVIKTWSATRVAMGSAVSYDFSSRSVRLSAAGIDE
jgi:hypothetical protein